jgi:hypothetical protein
MGSERRRDIRTRITVPAFVVRRSGNEAVQVVDASFRGVFVQMAESPPVRELIRLRITLPSGDLDMHAVVMRIVDDGGHSGVGLRFFALNGEAKAEWESFISSALHSRSRTPGQAA